MISPFLSAKQGISSKDINFLRESLFFLLCPKIYLKKNRQLRYPDTQDYAFYNFHILETGQDKDDILAEFHGTGLWWVEDKWTNALAGLKYGLKPLFIDHPYNREYSHPDITRVNNWKQIHEIVSNDGR